MNLWFLVVFFVISLPGAVILFRKKLDPSASRMDQPDQVVRALPYMTPPPWPPGMRWMVPPKTQRWLGELAQPLTGSAGIESAVAGGAEWEPIISDDHLLQLIGCDKTLTKNYTCYHLLLWRGSLPSNPKLYECSYSRQSVGGDQPIDTLAVKQVRLPDDVRHEMVSLGMDHPPTNVTLIEVGFGHLLVVNGLTLRVRCPAADPPIDSAVVARVEARNRPAESPEPHDPR